MSSFYASLLFEDVTHVTATFLDSEGRYEQAERVYKCNLHRDGLWSSSAVWRDCSSFESERVCLGRTAAVREVYGSESPELARRYQFVADNLDTTSKFDPKTQRTYCRMARDIFHRLKMHGRCAEMLLSSAMTYQVYDKAQFGPLYRTAIEELSTGKPMLRPWKLGTASWIASNHGEPKLSRQLHLYDLRYSDSKFDPLTAKLQPMNSQKDSYERLSASALIGFMFISMARCWRLGRGFAHVLRISTSWCALQSAGKKDEFGARRDLTASLLEAGLIDESLSASESMLGSVGEYRAPANQTKTFWWRAIFNPLVKRDLAVTALILIEFYNFFGKDFLAVFGLS